MTHLSCRNCGADRGDVDTGSPRCAACRRLAGEASAAEVAAALARADRSRGGTSPRVAWQTPLAPSWLWSRCPPAKDDPRRVLVIPVDE